jgi:hypothetical protein
MVYYEIQINLDTLTYSATLSDIDTQSLHEKC